eukprot:tig00021489_g21677.t1
MAAAPSSSSEAWQAASPLASRCPAKVLEKIAADSVVWSAAHGLLMAAKNTGTLAPVPYSLLPSPVPRALYDEIVALSPAFSELVLRLGRDPDFLFQSLEGIEEGDDFTQRLLSLYRTVQSEGLRQRIQLLITRSDYMMHWDGQSDNMQMKQVELNTIAAAAGMISEVACRLHRWIVERFAPPGYDLSRMPRNETSVQIPAAMAKAVALYRDSRPPAAPHRPLAVLMVVQSGEWNIFDQKHTETDPDSGALLFDEAGVETEIALVYYRAGYTPTDYPTEKEWAARLLVERSAAVKCPSLAHHLLGTKKVQQVLALPGVLERYVEGPLAGRLRRSFAGLYGLRPDELRAGPSAAAAAAAAARPEDFVLKPQREGGGNNLFGEDLRRALAGGMAPDQLAAHILMDRIRGPSLQSWVLKDGRPAAEEIVWELGIYGAAVADGSGATVHNRAAGHLLRSRLVRYNETGLSSGYGVLDSPYLC